MASPPTLQPGPAPETVRQLVHDAIEESKDLDEGGWFREIAYRFRVTDALVEAIAFAPEWWAVRVCWACRGRGKVDVASARHALATLECSQCGGRGFLG